MNPTIFSTKRHIMVEGIRLNNQDSEALFNALAKLVRFNKKLTAALKEHEQRVTNR